MKLCKTCGVEKESEEFYKRRDSCKECVKRHISLYSKSHREQINKRRREIRIYDPVKSKQYMEKYRQRYPEKWYTRDKLKLHNKYKVSSEFIMNLMDSQRGCCPICGESLITPESKKNYAIDHDHTTLQVRGLLCQSCNVGIGFLKESRNILQNAINYLSMYK